jgi:hypothetical protein
MSTFESELCALINKHSIDARLNTPDFIVTQYIMSNLEALETLNSSLNFHYNSSTDLNGEAQ